MNELLVLAVDPGTHKCGVAVVAGGASPRTVYRAVVPTPDLSKTVRALLAAHPVGAVVLGDATHTTAVEAVLRPLLPAGVALHRVPEAFTSQAARERWRTENPPRNVWERCFPGMRSPDCAVDDWAAVILAERFLASCT